MGEKHVLLSVSTTAHPSSSHRRKSRWGRLKQTPLLYTDPHGDASPQHQTWRHLAQHGFEAGTSRPGVTSSFLSFARPARPTQRRPGQFQVQRSIPSGRTQLSRPGRALCHQPHCHYSALSPPVIASLSSLQSRHRSHPVVCFCHRTAHLSPTVRPSACRS